MLGTGQAIEEFVDELTRAPDRASIWHVLRDHVRSKGLRAVLYNPHPGRAAIASAAAPPVELHGDGFATDWLDALRGGGAGADLALRQGARSSGPTLWSELAGIGGGRAPPRRTRRISPQP